MTSSELTTPLSDRIDIVRKTDDYAGAMMADIVDFISHERYDRAAQAAGHLLVHLAIKSGTKPFAMLRKVYRAS